MTRELAMAIMLSVAVLLLLLMGWGWMRRRRRDTTYGAPLGDIPAGAETVLETGGLYVATSVHENPLDRVALKPLAFRSRVHVTVTTAGVALDLPGAPRVFIPVDAIRGAGRATWTIDRVVEAGGLPFIAWEPQPGTLVDSAFRIQDGDPQGLVDAVIRILPQPSHTPTGATS